MTKSEKICVIRDAIDEVIKEIEKEVDKYDDMAKRAEGTTLKLTYLCNAMGANDGIIIAIKTKQRLLNEVINETEDAKS